MLNVTLRLWTLCILDPFVQNESQQVGLFLNLSRVAQQELVTEQGRNQTAMECPLRLGSFRSQCKQTQGDSVVKYHAGWPWMKDVLFALNLCNDGWITSLKEELCLWKREPNPPSEPQFLEELLRFGYGLFRLIYLHQRCKAPKDRWSLLRLGSVREESPPLPAHSQEVSIDCSWREHGCTRHAPIGNIHAGNLGHLGSAGPTCDSISEPKCLTKSQMTVVWRCPDYHQAPAPAQTLHFLVVWQVHWASAKSKWHQNDSKCIKLFLKSWSQRSQHASVTSKDFTLAAQKLLAGALAGSARTPSLLPAAQDARYKQYSISMISMKHDTGWAHVAPNQDHTEPFWAVSLDKTDHQPTSNEGACPLPLGKSGNSATPPQLLWEQRLEPNHMWTLTS